MGRKLVFLSLVMAMGCTKPKAPNTAAPEDKLLFEWGQMLLAGDKSGTLKFYDLELRQKLEFWDKTMKPVSNPTTQAGLLQTNLPRLGEAAAVMTTGDEAWAEVKDQPWVQELADGKCISGPPGKDDIGKGMIPKERKEMPQELGMWVFELRTSVNWAPAFRVSCPKTGGFWVQLSQRKKDVATGDDSPLKVVRIGK